MLLFNDSINAHKNLLPTGGEVHYYGKIFNENTANEFLFNLLKKIDWQNDEAIIFGKKIITKRKVAWYGDLPFEYTYSNITKTALPWNDDLVILREKVEGVTGYKYNSCLLNLYHSGEEGMAWHSDAEKDLVENGTIASLSFGAERKFGFKHKTDKNTVYINLEHGSLLTMEGETQKNWLHRLPPTKIYMKERVNLTFRQIVK